MARYCVFAGCILAALSGLAGQAVAQDAPRVGRDGYREGMPAVVTPPRRPAPLQEAPFAAAYRRAGFPRLVLFFNRDIADTANSEVVLRRQEVVSATRDGRLAVREQGRGETPGAAAPAKEEMVPAGQFKAGIPAAAESPSSPRQSGVEAHDTLQADRRTEISVRRDAVGARTAPLDEASQWLFETGFTGRLALDRVRMVDRAAAVRLASAARSMADPQQLEIAGIREHAELAVLVRAAAMPNAPGGQIFRITAVDTHGGAILADEIVTPPAGGSPAALATAAGDMAAAHLIARLTATWTPPR